MEVPMVETGPVSDQEARRIIAEWGRLHDLQAGLSSFLPIIAEEGFYMHFGERSWVGYADFEDHQITKRRFFDESHDYQDIKVEPGTERTVARTKMIWTAHYRPERSPRSKIMKSYLEHSWEFRRCAKTGRPFMQGHTVDLFEYLKGFAPDDAQDYDFHLDTKWGRR
jgi:hypothetical protein